MALSAFEQTTMNHVFQSWKEYDSFNEQKITMIEGDKCITGINMGINHEGALLIDEEGTIKTVYNGHLVI
jgi:BirA family biotin operon repressor/biotin-[acetyl-CoA-carboxylase] ligase